MQQLNETAKPFDLSGKRKSVSFIETPQIATTEDITEKKRREECIAACIELTRTVKSHLNKRFGLPETDYDVPEFIFSEIENLAEIHPITGNILLSPRILLPEVNFKRVIAHELLHYFCTRWVDFRKSSEYLIQGRQLGFSIRYPLRGEAVDGFGAFDEALIAITTKEVCDQLGITHSSDIDTSYPIEQTVLEKCIARVLPLKVTIFNDENSEEEKEFTTLSEIILELQKSIWTPRNLSEDFVKLSKARRKNFGRIMSKIFPAKEILRVAIQTRRKESGESDDQYHERLMELIA